MEKGLQSMKRFVDWCVSVIIDHNLILIFVFGTNHEG